MAARRVGMRHIRRETTTGWAAGSSSISPARFMTGAWISKSEAFDLCEVLSDAEVMLSSYSKEHADPLAREVAALVTSAIELVEARLAGGATPCELN